MKKHVIIISMLTLMASNAMAQVNPSVSFHNAETTTTLQDREIVTFTTYNQQEAIAWAAMMSKNGYNVVIEQKPRTGIYTCTAVR